MPVPYEILIRGEEDGLGGVRGAYKMLTPNSTPTDITMADLTDLIGEDAATIATLQLQVASLETQLETCQNSYSLLARANGGELEA